MAAVRVPSPCARPAYASGRVAVFDLLDVERDRIVGSFSLRAATGRWAAADPDLAGLGDPRALLAAAQDMTDQGRVARVVGALVRLASQDPGEPAEESTGEPAAPEPMWGEVSVEDRRWATQLLVHALLPGVKDLCARTWWMPRHPDGGSMWLLADDEERAAVALELLLASIRAFRWRSRHSAVNLALLSEVRTRLTRMVIAARDADQPVQRHADLDVAVGSHQPAVDEHSFYTAALIGLLRWARDSQVLTEQAVRLVAMTRLADRSPDELAAEQGMRVHTLRRRRQRAEATLARAARAAGRWPLPEPAWA
ncbi:hypothetical protein [Parafrankia discariae]|uniref:hypothetical protein n=1 Tax=Parafrankia discariae TaxID=365528 RepID=UPI00039D5669|nr:hypothetical protein [Parafrankia discariae]